MRGLGRFVAALASVVVVSSVAARAVRAEPVDLELVLAVDVSGSIDVQEASLQRAGTIAALTDPDIMKAIKSGMLGKIAVAYVEWAGAGRLRLIGDWAVISGPRSANAFAKQIAKAPITVDLYTSISSAIEFGLRKFEGNGLEGARKIIDVSGDGPNNQGIYVNEARDKAVKAGVTINGLPIVNNKPGRYGWPPFPQLAEYYEDCVIGGSGAFLVVAHTHRDFARAIKRKMLLEIAGRIPQRAKIWRAALKQRAKISCDIGESRVEDLTNE
ncbi:MAG: DUF1194 domain-containing protein [Proteobacteria bacterium]|nr:DUF1194 domain-containing protein [Pseudomonadota bacterium]